MTPRKFLSLLLAAAPLTLACTPAQRSAALRTTLDLGACLLKPDSPLARYVAGEIAADGPGARERFKAALAEGQFLRTDLACALYALGSVGSQEGATDPLPSSRLVARAEACQRDGGCLDVIEISAELILEAHKAQVVRLPPSGRR
jgi:hypothetical protein